MRRPISLSSEVLLTVGALAVLPSCGDLGVRELFTNPCGKNACATPVPQDCATLSKTSWSVGPLGSELDIAVGQSLLQYLVPNLESQCANSLSSVTWTADDLSVASVLAGGAFSKDSAWVTGVAPGVTAVRARIVFSDGGVQDAQPRSVRVAPPGPPTPPVPGSSVVAQGRVSIDAPPTQPGVVRAFIPFTLPAAGHVDVTIDWESPLNRLDFSAYQGSCSTVPCAGDIVMTSQQYDVKPITGYNTLSVGDYTIRIDNLGPGSETARYEVRLTPR
jgi:hypothetical protein